MGNDTKKAAPEKPAKPYEGFPLFAHATKRWAKKVRGHLRYFGPWADPAAAEAKWNRERDDLMAGREPRDAAGQKTVRDVVNAFLTSKENQRDRGELSQRSFRDYYDTCDRVIECFGKTPAAATLGPADFATLMQRMSKWAPVTRSNEIQRVRSLFKYAYDAELIPAPIKFGPDFKKPSRKTIRADKAEKHTRLFTREQIAAMLGAAGGQMKAMILLGINCGLGNTDISELDFKHLNLDDALLDYPRPKTSTDRRAMLWPETVEALRAVVARRHETLIVGDNKGKPRFRPEDPADVDAVFLTHQSCRFVRQDLKNNRDSIAMAFAKLLTSLGMKKKAEEEGERGVMEGVNFYSLRHTFETIAGGAKDQPAVDRIMGHVEEHTRGHYQHWTKDAEEDRRLRAVADHVHGWLYPPEPKEKRKGKAGTKATAKKLQPGEMRLAG